MTYQIISASNLTQLQAFVNNELAHGWSPTGGLITYTLQSEQTLSNPERLFAQALIRQTRDQSLH